jgi:hypothetical protein
MVLRIDHGVIGLVLCSNNFDTVKVVILLMGCP